METGPDPFRQGKTEQEARQTKTCMYCGQQRSMSEFRRRTGKRAGPGARRGACRSCRQLAGQSDQDDRSIGKAASPVKRERDGGVTRKMVARTSVSAENEQERIAHATTHGVTDVSEPKMRLDSRSLVVSSSGNDDEHAESVTSSPGNRKKRRRRRKSKRSDIQSGNEQAETSLKHEGSSDGAVVDPQPDKRWRGEGHSQDHAAANEPRAGAQAAAAVQAADQDAAAQALLPAEPQGPAAEPLAAEQPAAAKRKRKRRRKRAAALPPGAGQARSVAAEAHAPALGDRGDATTVTGLAAAAAGDRKSVV